MNWRSRGACPLADGSAPARTQAIAGQVIERRAGPAKRLDQIELVGAGPIVELLVFLLEIIGQLDRQEQLHADAGVPQEFVVEKRPDERPHLSRIALDLLRLIDAIDQDDDSRIAQRMENRLKLAQELISLFGTAIGSRRQGLASQLRWLEPE